MNRLKYDLVADQATWIEDVLSNDENSTDADLLAYFISNGLSREQARNVLAHRQDYLINIFLAGHGPLYEAGEG